MELEKQILLLDVKHFFWTRAYYWTRRDRGTFSSPGFGGTAPGEEAAANALGVRLDKGVLAIVLRRAGVVSGYEGSKSNGSQGLGISLASPLFRLSGRLSLTTVPVGAVPAVGSFLSLLRIYYS